jgi:hypothetical protein
MKMLSEKYLKDYMDTNSKYDFKAVLDRITDQEKISGIQLLNWTEIEAGEYLKSFHSVSAMALNRQFSILRNFADFICEKENISKRKFNLGEDKLYDFIDKEILLKTTLNYEEYRNIKSQLDENVRDKLIFELAWYGLANEDIKMLTNSDVIFEMSEDFGWEIAFLNIRDGFLFKVEDPEVVEDIKRCMKEMYHIIESKDGRTKKMQYRDSEYIIKPINVGKNKKEDYLCNPSLTLQKTFVAKDITCKDIDVYNLSIEDIRRSGLIYLLSSENNKEYSMDLITIIYGYKNDTGLYWLKNFAKEKYNK